MILSVSAVATVMAGCIDLSGAHGCTSDEDCRYGRVCNQVSGACTEPRSEERPDAGPDGDDVSVEPAPRITANPGRVDFERIDQADPTWRRSWLKTTVQNVGDAPLVISDITHTGGPAFELAFSDEASDVWLRGEQAVPDVLAAGQAFDIRVWYETETSEPIDAHISIDSNDPRGEFRIPLAADRSPPCVAVLTGEHLYFNPTEAVTKEVVVANCSDTATLAIRDVRLVHDSGGSFYVDQESLPERLPEFSALVAPGEQTSFEVVYAGVHHEWNAGELLIETNVPDRRHIYIGLYRQTDANDCPVARGGARLGEDAPLVRSLDARVEQTIELSAAGSTDPDGEIAAYQWTVVDRPHGSTARVRPDEGARDAEFFLDRPGRYAFDLQVWDEEGLTSCNGADRVTVTTQGDSRTLRVELDWQTPGDPDPSDTHGANLDLHYLHPSGRYGQPPWDVFSANPSPDWSRQDRPDESPELDRDVTHGDGPEIIEHATPEPNLVFRTGAYYVDDAGLGTSMATARVYVDDILLHEASDQPLEVGQFWEVTEIVYPGPDVTIVDEVFEGFPE